MRLSVVDFVNAWPLTWGFLEGEERDVEVVRDAPSACADRLGRGEVDGGLVPVVELARFGARFERVPGLGIAARGAARSVLLVAKRPLDAIATVAVDAASRSSVALVRLLLEARAGLEPSYVARPARMPEMLDGVDAALLIGDPALRLRPPAGARVHDLAAEWLAWTGLPFVFAAWAVKPGTDPTPFHRSRAAAKRDIARIVREGARATGLAEATVEQYLLRDLVHDLGAAEEAGLGAFVERAARLRPLAVAAISTVAAPREVPA